MMIKSPVDSIEYVNIVLLARAVKRVSKKSLANEGVVKWLTRASTLAQKMDDTPSLDGSTAALRRHSKAFYKLLEHVEAGVPEDSVQREPTLGHHRLAKETVAVAHKAMSFDKDEDDYSIIAMNFQDAADTLRVAVALRKGNDKLVEKLVRSMDTAAGDNIPDGVWKLFYVEEEYE